MRKELLLIAAAGWFAAFWLAFCSTQQGDDFADSTLLPDANAGDQSGVPEHPHAGSLWVVDADERPVGLALGRRHPMLDDYEGYDAISVYSPRFNLFFALRMSSGEVLRPAKVFFSGGSCQGIAGLRAARGDAVSGFDLAFKTGGQWFRVDGGVERQSITYSSYLPEALGEPCTAHGSSQTYIFPATALSDLEAPPEWRAPFSFRWVIGN